jgi:EAL domain-containing protein (putative c-di-GMP-specific phosphodiesterase class I)/GGDEF domain-containing protein
MIVTDISMPAMDGLEMTRRIKQIDPLIPVIVTTAYSSTNHLFEAIDIHVDKYVIKPLDARKLLEAMRQSILYHELRNILKDPLTGLKTRYALLKDLEKETENRLVMLRIRHFANLKELFGDEISNQTLIELTKRLNAEFAETFRIYHTAEDTFVLVDRDLSRTAEVLKEHLEMFAHRCRYEGMEIDGVPIYLIVTFSVAQSHDGHTLVYAQQTLQAHEQSPVPVVEYRQDASEHLHNYRENIRWVLELDRGPDNDHLTARYQPIVETETGRIYKYEALIRYVDDAGNITPPVVFLEIARKANLYPNIIRIMLSKTLQTIRDKQVRIAINVSYLDLIDRETMHFIASMLTEWSQEARLLEFEILESERIDNYQLAGAFIHMVKQYGCRVGIDDFGIGYSNFGMLEALEVDYVKINGQLIVGMDQSQRQRFIVESIHTFCHQLGIKTVAEMVSTEAEYRVARSIGIDYIQGWYFSRDIDSSEIEDAR